MNVRKIWWLNPVCIYVIILGLVLGAYSMDSSKYSNIYGMEKAINEKHLVLYFLSFVFFLIGYEIARKYRVKSRVSGLFWRQNIDINSVYKIFNLLFTLCIAAYTIWYVNAIRINGSVIFSALINIQKLAQYSNYLYLHNGRISGITTFTEMGNLVAPLGTYLIMFNDRKSRMTKSVKKKLVLLFFLCLIRASLFSERVALIEVLLPSFVVFMVYQNKMKSKFFISLLPIIGVVALFLVFGIFEYARSWSAFYKTQYTSYFDFIYTRILGYYCGSINTECIYFDHIGCLYAPHYTLNFIWNFPFFSDIAELWNPKFSFVLRSYGNPEFNNASGLLAYYSDFGIFAPCLYTIFGYFIGRCYRMFMQSNIYGVVTYAYIFYLLLELPRFYSFGTSAFLVFCIALFIFAFRSKNTVKKG